MDKNVHPRGTAPLRALGSRRVPQAPCGRLCRQGAVRVDRPRPAAPTMHRDLRVPANTDSLARGLAPALKQGAR